MATHKLTIRIDEDVWPGFERVCQINGASFTALIQAWCEVMISETERHDGKPLTAWDDYPPAAPLLLERAREIDAKRRNRRRPQ